MEYRRFLPGESPVSTLAYHHDRERAPHREQGAHMARMSATIEQVGLYISQVRTGTTWPLLVVDLGCGDGGTLQMLEETFDTRVRARGYDFQPSNAAGWLERGVIGHQLSFVDNWAEVMYADLYIMTEVLEHLEDPHGAVRRVADRGAALVCSSPWTEYEGNIDGSHSWAWDMPGYGKMIQDNGMRLVNSMRAQWSQVHLAVPA